MNEIHRIAVILNDRSFEYDIYTLVIAFFQGVKTQVFDPGQEIPEDTDLVIKARIGDDRVGLQAGGTVREIAVPEPGERKVMKNIIKRNLYEMLRDLCGRDLPWGNLTGIRPVKLAMQFLLEAAGDSEKGGTAGQPENKDSTDTMDQSESKDKAGTMDQSESKDKAGTVVWSGSKDKAGTVVWSGSKGKTDNGILQAAGGSADYARIQMQERYFVSRQKAELAVRIAQRENSILRSIDTKNGYSLYIGIPFCPSICLYCSFSSSPLGLWQDRVDEYLDALIREMTACRLAFPGKTLHTVYVGGGTPTTLSPGQMDRLLTAVEENFDLSDVMEFTVEAGRPDSITREKLEVLRKHPVSRISVNPQTMNQKTLDLIGRKHTVEDTVEAFEMARTLGFDNINMDLIVGLPAEGLEEVETTMRMIESLDPDDVTVHALALKRAARLAMHMDEYEKISFQASDRIMDMCQSGCERLGMSPYYLYRQKNMAGNFENVGYAKRGKAGLYNILIMEEVECILALGASGSTKIVYDDGRIERIENVKDIRNYLERIDEMIDRKAPILG